jgi:acyl-coenzyme A synthetase/AMP-(fatty) acid ligase
MLRLAPLAFDASTLEIFVPLLTGGTLEVAADTPVAPGDLAVFLVDRGVTVAWLPAGLFRLMVDDAIDGFSGVRQIVTGGDVVSAAHVRRLLARYPALVVVNGYGPTENTTFTTVHVITVDDAGQVSVPIGRPVAGTAVYVVDEDGHRLPPGQTGELVVAGSGLALGYLGAPEATAEAFVELADIEGCCYRTGDLVRWNSDGRLDYVGRRDRQIKLRGHRIELEEIENCLRESSLVSDVTVVAVGDPGTRRILCGVVATWTDGLTDLLREHLAARLPAYMVPQLWSVVEKLPLTTNGKVDVAQLESLANRRPAGAALPDEPGPQPAAPVGSVVLDRDLADLVHRVWADVLGFSDFGLDEGFFDVGGDSLMAARVHTRLVELLPQHHIRIVDIFQYPTVGEFTAQLGQGVRR